MGKTVVITGAGVGLGRAIARRFASEGETCILLGRTLSKVQALAEELGDPHFAVECDVGDAQSVRAAFAKIAERHPKIDVLINNAAYYEPGKARDVSDEVIERIVRSNFIGPIYTCRAALAMMERGGFIINVSSESVKEPFVMLSLYQSTKMGMERFSEALLEEVKADGIRVCVVRAGPMTDGGEATSSSSQWEMDDAIKFYEENLKIGRNLGDDPISDATSVTDVFRMLLDLKPDFRVTHVNVGARHP
ncbi:MAG: SDR family NAD(P)-dependent oxidoreductase [Novosphingobium sp.]|nr:SDR family NAD(P)-dependent oxidoreductase [Novosphingobium sp.]